MVEEVDAGTVLRARLLVGDAIDKSAELSFLESAHFRLELFQIVSEIETCSRSPVQAAGALDDLHSRVAAVVAAAP